MKQAFLWSVRREVWEHRSVWLAPLAVAAFVLAAFLLGITGVHEHTGSFGALPPDKQQMLVAMPFSLAASVILLVAFIVGVFYSLDALVGERRDRSILFWKSMPVSDATTVLAKAAVPFIVIPVVASLIVIATQAILLGMASVGLKAMGVDIAPLWERLPVAAMPLVMLYGVAAHTLWHAPLYALLLMVSAVARRPLLWVLLPAIVVQVLERIAFGTAYSGAFIKYRLLGAMTEAFRDDAMSESIVSLGQLDPVRFLSSPGLWLGLLFAAAFLYAAVRLRRLREPF